MDATGSHYYDKIAHLYDIMYNPDTGFDHMAQVQWVDDWRAKLNLPKTVLDLACGTGQHLACFEALGYATFGIDASRRMLDVAARRLHNTPLQQGFFHSFRRAEEAPLITCFFNALGYNTNLSELRQALQNIRANLLDDGLLVFDVVCTTAAEPVFNVRAFEGNGLQFSRTFIGIPTAEGFKSTLYYVVFDGRSSEVIEETTLRGIFSASDIQTALAECGFVVLYEGSGYTSGLTVFVALNRSVIAPRREEPWSAS